MESILTLLVVIDWLANDLHYGADHNFYARHLLADRVRDFGSAEDDIKEKYYLGWKKEQPPADAQIAEYAIKTKAGFANVEAIFALIEAIEMLIGAVETAKGEGYPCGVQAVLDDISSRALTNAFLLRKEAQDAR